MNNLLKAVVTAAAVGVLALGVVGCGKKEEKKAEPAANATAAAPAGPKTLLFATDATYPPMQYLNDQKEVVGFEVEVIKAAAAKGGFRAEFKNVPWDGIFAGLAEGKYDAVSSCISITDERKTAMDFSDPILSIDQVLVVAKNDKVTGLAGMKGKTIGVQADTISQQILKDEKGLKAVKGFADADMALNELLKGGVQGAVLGRPAANAFLATHADKLKIAAALKSFDIGVAVKKGDKDVLALINKGLAAIKADGTFDKIKAQHKLD